MHAYFYIIIEMMIEKKGANNFNHGLYGACKGCNILAIDLTIKKGANDFNNGLHKACYMGLYEHY